MAYELPYFKSLVRVILMSFAVPIVEVETSMLTSSVESFASPVLLIEIV
jgi:hypothetical protein